MANVGMPLQFSRMYKGPLDEKDIFESFELAQEYANSPIGYPGHVISVKTTEYRRDAYIINDDKSLSHLSTTRADMDITLKATGWSPERPYSYRVSVPDLYESDNVVVSMGSESTREQYDAVINARITNIEQGDGFVIFYCDEDKPEVDIDIRLVVGGLINAVEVPNSATVETKHKTIRVYSTGWDQTSNTYRVIIEDLTKNDYVLVSIAGNLSADQTNMVYDADIAPIEQGNGYIILQANGALPTMDFDIVVAFGDNIVVVPDEKIIRSETYSKIITLAAAGWVLDNGISTNKYSQSFLLEGMTETVNGSIFLPPTLTDEEIETLASAEISIVQAEGSITFICNGVIPMFDITIGITYGSYINIIQSAPVFADRTSVGQYTIFKLLPENWMYSESLELYLYTLTNLTDLGENPNGYIGLTNNISKEAEIEALSCEMFVYSTTEDSVTIGAVNKPTLEIPINLIFGSNIIVARPNYYNTNDLTEAKDIVYKNKKISMNDVESGLDYAINQNPSSCDPSRTIMASVDNFPNGIIIKDAYNNKNYIIRMENGVMSTTELDNRILPYFNGIEFVHYPLNVYNQKENLPENNAILCWTSLIGIEYIVKSGDSLVYYTDDNRNGKLAIGTISEILEDLDATGNYIVFDVKSNCYLEVYNGSLYYTGGLYEYPKPTSFKVHGTIADRPLSADKKGTIYYNETNGEYYIWDGTSWNIMPTRL